MGFFSRKPKPSRRPETLTPLRINFIGEQTGSTEDDLKSRFRQLFASVRSVQSAYLARLSYGGPPEYSTGLFVSGLIGSPSSPSAPSGNSVGLCIRSTIGIDAGLQKRIGQIFAEVFRQAEWLDVVFIRDDQELELKKVCRPFFEAS